MTLQQITAADIAGWDSLEAIADSLEKRGLKPHQELGEENQLVVQLADDEFIVLVEAGPGESATDFKPQDTDRRHTNLVATNDFEEFTFITRVRTFGQQHGQIKHQKLSFSKSQFTSDSGEKHTILQKLNEIEYGSSAAIYGDLYDTKQIVEEFYEKFEALRTDLVQEVSGIPGDRGDAKQRYVQVTLDRMIFLYFIQEKRLLDRDLEYLHDHHERVVEDGGDVYEEFYEPLFFELLAEGKQDPEFGSLPYLNGGLFTTNPVEEEFPEAKLGASTEETNELFGRVLDFLSEWNWNVDERLDIVDPKNLSPAVLGHIFEQTVNQKEMGAYYTPEEITGFMARRSIHPYLLDQLNEAVGADYQEIDEIFALNDVDAGTAEGEVATDGGAMTQQAPPTEVQTEHVETLYFDVLRDVRVLDPAVGSGAFLLAAQDVLLDVYLQCLEFFEELEAAGQGWELASRTREELQDIHERSGSKALYAKRNIILENLYGVDIDDGAVEICKLRLWLSMVADIEDEPTEVEPLPNIDFNIRQGNSLIGYTDLIEKATTEGDASLTNYGVNGEPPVREFYEDIIEAQRRHKQADTATEAQNARKIAESLISEYSIELNEKVLDQFHRAGVEDLTLDQLGEFDPFHWVLQFALVYAEGGFDVIIGNPPWDQLRASRDDYFVKYDEQFRSRMPSDKDEKEEDLLRNDEIAEGWEEYQEDIEMQMRYFTDGSEYTLQTPVIDGRKDPNENNLAALFFERVFKLAKADGYVAQVLPGVMFSGSFSKDLRLKLIEDTEVQSLVGFENKGIFSDLHPQYQFAVLTFKNQGTTDTLKGVFNQHDLSVLAELEKHAVEIPDEVLKKYSLKAHIFPNIESQTQVSILQQVISHPPLDENINGTWNVTPHRELDRSRASDRFVEDEIEGDYPVYGGKNIHQFLYDDSIDPNIAAPELWSVDEDHPSASAKYRVRERSYNSGDLKRAIYTEFGGENTSKSQKRFVNDLLEESRGEKLSIDDVLPDFTEYRIVYRDIARPTDERTMIGTVLPKGIVCVHTLQTFSPYSINPTKEDLEQSSLHSVYDRAFSDRELFVISGLINSIPFDFLLRTKVDSHIVRFKLEESQMPRLTDGDDWFHYISERAAQLNCYGDNFSEMRDRLGGIEPATDQHERRQLQAEIDAAAFHAYGLTHEDTKFVLDDFHRVENPRLMDEAYFEMVLEKYEELDETGPKP